MDQMLGLRSQFQFQRGSTGETVADHHIGARRIGAHRQDTVRRLQLDGFQFAGLICFHSNYFTPRFETFGS